MGFYGWKKYNVLDGKNSVVLKQAKNRMYIQQAILIYVLKK